MAYFEVTYNPATWNSPQGGVATSWTTPYGGLNTQTPENLIPPSDFPLMNNIMIRNNELRSRPPFKQLLPGPDGNNQILSVGSFLSPNSVWHTFAFTPRGMFQLEVNPFAIVQRGMNPWVYLGGPTLTPGIPVQWKSFQGILYYTNGLHLSGWDGVQNTPVKDMAFLTATAATGTVIGAQFIAELNNHILLAYTNETATGGSGATTTYPYRLRWSNIGFNPTTAGSTFGSNLGTGGATFDPTINVNAGFNDFLDVPDIITGIMTVGHQGYVFRQNGITTFKPTGNGLAPFSFDHLWASNNGVGNVLPFSIAQYGNMGMFISFEQIYQVSADGMAPVGGKARDAIIFDIARATASPIAHIMRGFQQGYSYLTYHLRIPVAEGTRVYVYNFEDQNWSQWTESGIFPTGVPDTCWV